MAANGSGVALSSQNWWQLTQSLSSSSRHLTSAGLYKLWASNVKRPLSLEFNALNSAARLKHLIRAELQCPELCAESLTSFNACACSINTLIWIQILFVFSHTRLQAWNAEGEIDFWCHWKQWLLKAVAFIEGEFANIKNMMCIWPSWSNLINPF